MTSSGVPPRPPRATAIAERLQISLLGDIGSALEQSAINLFERFEDRNRLPDLVVLGKRLAGYLSPASTCIAVEQPK